MTSVDLELCWGEERLACSSHAVDAVLTPGGPFPAMRLLAPDGDAFVLFVPPRARGWLLTANGWRDLSTLRVLGCLAPDPACPGGARIRLRLLRDARGMEDGVVLVRRVDAWLEIEGWWLRVSLGDDVAAPPRINRRALGRGLLFAALSLSCFGGVLTAFASVEPRHAQLDLDRLAATRLRLPPVRTSPEARATPTRETKHDVDPAPNGAPPSVEPPIAAPALERRDRRARGPRSTRGARAAEGVPLPRLRAAVDSFATLGSPRQRRSGGASAPLGERDSWLALATLTGYGGPDRETMRASAERGPSWFGAGLGDGRLRPRPRPRRSGVVLPQHRPMMHCDARWRDQRGRPSCHPGSLLRQAVRAVVRRELPALTFCYERGRDRVPSLSGRLAVSWRLTDSGAAEDVRVVESSLPDDLVTACVLSAIRGWRFPSGHGGARVHYPFVFRVRTRTAR